MSRFAKLTALVEKLVIPAASRKRYRLLMQYLHYRLLFGRDLPRLATLFSSDKWGQHWYAQHYQRHFDSIRKERINLLEIGIGGYEDPEGGGHSLRMWRTYFPNGRIYGIDIHDKTYHEERRIKTFQGSQADPAFLERVAAEIGRLDIVIDDGSHQNEHVLIAFRTLFPHLSEKGIYVIEDAQTSYWPEFGGDSEDLNRPTTTMGFLKQLADGLNYEELRRARHAPSYLDTRITSVHFYHNLAFIYKGRNAEGSNAPYARPIAQKPAPEREG